MKGKALKPQHMVPDDDDYDNDQFKLLNPFRINRKSHSSFYQFTDESMAMKCSDTDDSLVGIKCLRRLVDL